MNAYISARRPYILRGSRLLLLFFLAFTAFYPMDASSSENQTATHHVWITVIGNQLVPVKQQPKPFAPVVKTYKPGAQLLSKGHKNGWYEIDWKGVQGFVHEMFARETPEKDVRVLKEEKHRQAKLVEKRARQKQKEARRQKEQKDKKISYILKNERQKIRKIVKDLTGKNLSDRSLSKTRIAQKYQKWQEEVEMEGYGVGAFVGGMNKNFATGVMTRVLSKQRQKYPSCLVTKWATNANETVDDVVREAMILCRKKCNDCRIIARRPILSVLQGKASIAKPSTKTSTNSSQAQEPQVVKNLRSNDSQTVRQAARNIYDRHLNNKEITDAVNQELLKSYDQAAADSIMQDAQAWMCKILGTTGDKEYASTLITVSNSSPSRKVRRYAASSLRQLR